MVSCHGSCWRGDLLELLSGLAQILLIDEGLFFFILQEVLTMKRGAVQNSPTEKPQHEPSPWSPVGSFCYFNVVQVT